MLSRLSLLLGLMVAASSSCGLAKASPLSQDLWYSVYFQGQHSGYTHLTTVPDTYNGQPASRDNSSTLTKITVFGTLVEQDVESTSWSDPKSGVLFYQTFKIQSGGTETDVDATFSTSSVTALLKSGTDQTTKVIPIPAGEKIVDGDMEGMTATGPLKVGQTETDLEFDPLTLTLEKQTSKVITVDVPVKNAVTGYVTPTAKIDVQDPNGDAIAYQDASGIPLKISMPAGIFMVYCSQSDALSTDNSLASYATDQTTGDSSSTPVSIYHPSPDLAVSTSVSPEGQSIGDARKLESLTVKLMLPGQPDKIVTETAVAVPPKWSSALSTLPSSATAPFLDDAPYLSLDSPAISQTAKEIAGNDSDSYTIVKHIHDYVYSLMSPKGSLGVPRAASDIIANPVGVCRDYAILFTSLSRAAGIPTKVCAGLVGYQGKFYYHAWAMSFIGGSVGWLPVDATMPTMFVDASHIALGSGDPTVMFALADVIGNMRVETLKTSNSL
jgi:hypothetical protein